MTKPLRIEGQVRPNVLRKDDTFQLEAPQPLLEYPYSETDAKGIERERFDRLVVVRFIRDGKADDKPSVAWMRDQDYSSLEDELKRSKLISGLDPANLKSYIVVVVDRGVRVYEKR